MAAVLSLGRIGKSKLLTWGQEVMESLHAAGDDKFPEVRKAIHKETKEIFYQRQELLLRLLEAGGPLPPQI